MVKKIFLIIIKTLFPISFFVGFVIDSYYKFDIQEETLWYNVALISYGYFCAYIAICLVKLIIKIKRWLIRAVIYIFTLAIPIFLLIFSDKTPDNGILSTFVFLIFAIIFFTALFLTVFRIYKLRKMIMEVIIGSVVVLTVIWFVWNEVDRRELAKKNQKTEEKKTDSVLVSGLQSWQLNSRYKINKVVKYLKVDLDKDGKEELAAITSYDKMTDEVFYYAGFYRYNMAREIWEEFYSEELNILNYGGVDKEKIDDIADFNKRIIDMWSNEFTTLKNIGDVTGDDCPEIVFSSLIQGKYFDNNIIVAQAGSSHYRFKVLKVMETMAQIVSEDGLLIEKYQDENNNIKDIYQWDAKNLYFKLIESQKTKIVVPADPIKIAPELERLSV